MSGFKLLFITGGLLASCLLVAFIPNSKVNKLELQKNISKTINYAALQSIEQIVSPKTEAIDKNEMAMLASAQQNSIAEPIVVIGHRIPLMAQQNEEATPSERIHPPSDFSRSNGWWYHQQEKELMAEKELRQQKRLLAKAQRTAKRTAKEIKLSTKRALAKAERKSRKEARIAKRESRRNAAIVKRELKTTDRLARIAARKTQPKRKLDPIIALKPE